MDTYQKIAVPKWFWLLASVLLLWNLLGVMAFFQHISIDAEHLQTMVPQERELYNNQPLWVIVAFAVAVFGGALGCLLLLFRISLALPVLILSVVGIVLQSFHSFIIAQTLEVYGTGALVMPSLVLLVGLFLIWFAYKARQKAWLN